MHQKNPIICALDTADLERATTLAKAISGKVAMAKVGLEFFTAHGLSGVQKIVDLGFRIFLDLKLHDIPNTVRGALKSVVNLPAIDMLTIHVSGGKNMIMGAIDALKECDIEPVGVTVLTSMDDVDLRACGINSSVEAHVMNLVDLAVSSGLNAIVCSAKEVASIRKKYPSLKLVVPGIRMAQSATGDQKRVDTPKDTLAAGADYLVIGRVITQSSDPAGEIDKILKTL
ncbi:orotidine-5'-phosphate decarboxylase [Anaplasma phagocytophilum]|nr:orotidine-5'-phosphate decarboxylase [Anaplasma phagocytophilum]ABD44009.1 orotidine 5'-phosphate decarboxylase [Anaplasma phagocytophilum str. HZ]AGR78830.1 orotidine 5'-phosphate decarboxylase [Anaplasma phagocytophilum str. HZ2]